MSNSIFKRWVRIFLMIAFILWCVIAINKVWFSTPTVKVDNSIVDVMARSDNLTHLYSASGDVGIDVIYLKDPLTDTCYALISGSFPNSETTFDGMAYIPCEKLE